MKKKWLLFLLTALLCIVGMTVMASAATVGNYTYTVSNGKATITDFPTSVSGAITIPSTLGGYPVTSIGDKAFYGCYSLTSVTIGNSVTSIGERAFVHCYRLTSVTIGDSVTSIGDEAFESCSSLTSIEIPDSVTSIGERAFWDCSSLTSVTIGDSVTSIGSSAFSGCSSLTSVTIGDSVTSIGHDAFRNCSSLTSVTIGDSVTSIGNDAFCGCVGLADDNGFVIIRNVLCDYCGEGGAVTIPSSVTSIGDYAFRDCSSLTSVVIPDSVTSIGWQAFYNCSSLTSVTIPDGVTSIEDRAFEECSKLEYNTYDNGLYLGNSKNPYVVLMDTTSEDITSCTIYPNCKVIYEYAFDGCSSLTSIEIPDSVTSIGGCAFASCSSLTSIEIPDSVESIGEYAFDGCSSLTSIEIPDSVTSIGEGAFAYCSRLRSITVTADNPAYQDIDGVLFNKSGTELVCYPAGKTNTAYSIPAGVTSIGGWAFSGCDNLTSIEIPDSVTSIGGDYAFASCSSLTSIAIPDSVTSIGFEAFAGCSSLTSVTIGYSVTSIGENAFYRCSSLTSIEIPDSVTSIGDEAFEDCYSLTSVTIGNSVTSIGYRAFESCRSLTSVTIGNSVTSIEDNAFRDCSSLTSVVIPDSVTSIGEYAFKWCDSLTSIVIPDSVTSIEGYAFEGCYSLTDIYYTGTEAQWTAIKNRFNDILRGVTIHYNYVPHNTHTYGTPSWAWTDYSAASAKFTCSCGNAQTLTATITSEVTEEPTHTTTGVRTYTATVTFGKKTYTDTKTETISATEHTYNQQNMDAKYLKSAATCTEAAVYYKSCLCGAAGTETFTYGDPAGHSYGTPSYVWDGANCTAGRACTKCSAEISGHTQTETAKGRYVKDTDATCTACEKGHYEANFTNQTFITQSTAKGSVDQGTPFGHSFPETWEKHNETQHKHTCTRCHTEVEYENHTWNGGDVITQPTHLAEGEKTFTCTKCGETKTEPIAKLTEQNIWKSPDVTWTYGEKTQITVNFTNLSENGGALSYASSNESVATVTAGLTGCTVNIIGAGETTITATAAAVSGKYLETGVSVKLTINPAPMTVTAENLSISYGSEASDFDYTVSGLVLGESAADVLSGTPEYQCAYRQYDNVGNYPITVSGLNAVNYTISYQPGTLAVEKLADYTMSFVENTLLQSVDHRIPVLVTITPQDSTAQILVEYYADAVWTNTPPTTYGTYPVRASLAASDNLVIPQTPIYIEDSLIIRDGAFIGNKDVMIDVTEKQDGSVEIGELTPEQIQAVTDDAAAKDKSVTLDLTGNGVASGAQGLTIPASLVDAMNDSSDVESFTVKAKDAEIKMDSGVLNTLSDSLAEGSKLTIQMETVNQNDLSADQKDALESIGGGSDIVVLDLKLIAKQYDEHGTEIGSNEIHQLGGVASVQVAYDFEETDGKILVALFVDENGNTTYLPVTYKDGFVSFRTDHFSVYAVMEIEKTDCGHSWNDGVVTLEPTTTSTGIKTFTCLICGETKTEIIAKKTDSGNIGGGGTVSAEVQIADDISHGKISADMDMASAGKTVTLTVAPDKGFTLETITVLDKNGEVIEVKNLGSNKFSFKMPSGKVSISATFIEDNSMLNFFVDVNADDYFYDAVLWAAENDITNGTDAVHFSPKNPVTRAQVVTFLWRAAGYSEPTGDASRFTDVPSSEYYAKAVAWAIEQGITKGTDGTTFSPDMVCTRGQIVTFLARFAGVEDADTASAFTDVKTNDYFATAVKWAKDNKVTEGTSATTFSPNEDCTRGQVVTFLWRWMVK